MQQWQQPRNPQYHIWNQRYQKDTLKDKTNRFGKKNKRTDTKEQPQQHLSINQAQQQERPKGFFQEERGSWLPKASHILKDKKRHTRAHNRKNGNEKQVQKYNQNFQCHFGADPPPSHFWVTLSGPSNRDWRHYLSDWALWRDCRARLAIGPFWGARAWLLRYLRKRSAISRLHTRLVSAIGVCDCGWWLVCLLHACSTPSCCTTTSTITWTGGPLRNHFRCPEIFRGSGGCGKVGVAAPD